MRYSTAHRGFAHMPIFSSSLAARRLGGRARWPSPMIPTSLSRASQPLGHREGRPRRQDQWVVGATLPEFKHNFFAAQMQAILDAGKKYGFKVEVRDGENDPAKQGAIIDEFIVKKVESKSKSGGDFLVRSSGRTCQDLQTSSILPNHDGAQSGSTYAIHCP